MRSPKRRILLAGTAEPIFNWGGGGGWLAPGARVCKGAWGHPPPENFEIEMSSSQKVHPHSPAPPSLISRPPSLISRGLFTQACVFFDVLIQQMNCNVLAAMVSVRVCPMLLVFAVTPVLLSSTGIPLARVVSNVSAILAVFHLQFKHFFSRFCLRFFPSIFAAILSSISIHLFENFKPKVFINFKPQQ